MQPPPIEGYKAHKGEERKHKKHHLQQLPA